MPEKMSISVNGHSQVPPGFRFHPTEEELLQYYLRKKVSYEKIDLDVIRDVDLNKLEPWDIQEKCKIGSTPQNDWYFFSHKDKKYPTGTRTNRATAAGFWKATGRDKVIYSNGGRIGMRKTLVFYKGRAPHGQKSDWIMHEYRLDDNITITTTTSPSPSTNMDSMMMTMMGDNNNNNGGQEEGWVVCRIFKKKNHLKTLDTTSPSDGGGRRSSCHVYNDDEEGALEHILDQMASCKEENQSNYNNNNNPRFAMDSSNNYFLKLPSLESPKSNNNNNNGYNNNHNHHHHHHHHSVLMDPSFSAVHHQAEAAASNGGGLANWAALDRLVASQLNGQKLDCFNDPMMGYCINDVVQDLQLPTLRSSSSSTSAHRAAYVGPPAQDYTTTTTEIDLWAFARSASSDTLCHVSNTSL